MSFKPFDQPRNETTLPQKCQALKRNGQVRKEKVNSTQSRYSRDNLIYLQRSLNRRPNNTLYKYRIEQMQKIALQSIKEVSEELECENDAKNQLTNYSFNFNQKQFNQRVFHERKFRKKVKPWKFRLHEDEILAASIISIAIVGYLMFKIYNNFYELLN